MKAQLGAVALTFAVTLGFLISTPTVLAQSNNTPRYAITDLGAFAPFGINSSGQVVGWAQFGDDLYVSVIYTRGVLSVLPTLGGRNGAAYGINNFGDVVGTAQDASGTWHPFLYRNGVIQDLDALLPSGWTWVTVPL